MTMTQEPQQPRPDYRRNMDSGPAGPGAQQPPHGGGPGSYGPGYARTPGGPGWGSTGPRDDEKTVAVLTHLAGPIAAVISVGWLGFVGPLIVWLVYKDKSPFLRRAAAGAFNFNVTLWLINVVGWVCVFTVLLAPVGFLLIVAYWVLLLVFHIMAAVKAGHGEAYRYPLQAPILH